MSEVQSALPDARFDGLVRIEEMGPQGMVTVKGDLASSALKMAVMDVAGATFPGARAVSSAGERSALWMAPDEVLVLVPYREAESAAKAMAGALAGHHGLVANVSDARALFRISGEEGREVLAKLAPVDLHPDSFGLGHLRRTRLAQVPAAFWICLLYTSPSPRDRTRSRMPSSA